MRSIRSLLGVGRRAFAARLDHLRESLDELGERLRAAVVQAISQNIGGIVADTLHAVLGSYAEYGYANHLPYESDAQASPSADATHSSYANGAYDQSYPWPNEPGYDEPTHTPERSNRPTRMATAVATGFRAAAWWLRGWAGHWSLLGGVAVGLTVTLAAFFAGPLADVGLHLVEAADHFTGLGKSPFGRSP